MTKKENNNVYAIITHSLDGSELRKYMFHDAVYEVVRMLSDGAELRRYTFYDGSIHSAIVDGDIIIGAVPIEKEYDLVAWWETELEVREVEKG